MVCRINKLRLDDVAELPASFSVQEAPLPAENTSELNAQSLEATTVLLLFVLHAKSPIPKS